MLHNYEVITEIQKPKLTQLSFGVYLQSGKQAVSERMY
jgi:hypothetical protein